MSVVQEFTFEKFPFEHQKCFTTIVGSENKKLLDFFKFCYPEDTPIVKCDTTEWQDRIKFHKQFVNNKGHNIFYGYDINPFFYTVSDILVFTTNESLKYYIQDKEYSLTFDSSKNFIVVYKHDKIIRFYTLDSTVFN